MKIFIITLLFFIPNLSQGSGQCSRFFSVPSKREYVGSAFFRMSKDFSEIIIEDKKQKIYGNFVFDSANDNILFRIGRYLESSKRYGSRDTLPVMVRGYFIIRTKQTDKIKEIGPVFIITEFKVLGAQG